MCYFKWRHLAGVGALTSFVFSASAALAQSEVQTSNPPLSSAARNVILNDSRTTPSADAASDAMRRGVDTPDLNIKSPSVANLAAGAAAAASCELAALEFEVGSAELSSSALQELSPVAQCLKNQRSTSMWLIGEADNLGTDATNWVLAMDRALAVKDALRAMGVDSQRLLAVSAGATGERSVSLELSESNPRTKLSPG